MTLQKQEQDQEQEQQQEQHTHFCQKMAEMGHLQNVHIKIKNNFKSKVNYPTLT